MNGRKLGILPIADGAITYDTNTRSVYVNRDADNTECLYENLFADPEEPTRNGLIKESYSDTFNLALARDDLLQSIGNLTLVTRELNSKLGNRTFPKKKEALNKHSGLKLNNEVCQHNAWDVNEIHAKS